MVWDVKKLDLCQALENNCDEILENLRYGLGEGICKGQHRMRSDLWGLTLQGELERRPAAEEQVY